MKKKLVLATLLSLVMMLTFTGCKKDVAYPDHFEVSDTEYGDEIKGIELTAVSDVKDSIKKENLYIFVYDIEFDEITRVGPRKDWIERNPYEAGQNLD